MLIRKTMSTVQLLSLLVLVLFSIHHASSASTTNNTTNKTTYVIMAPKNLRAGSNYTITIAVLVQTPAPVTVNARLIDPAKPSSVLVYGTCSIPAKSNGNVAKLSLQIALNASLLSTYSLLVNGSGGLQFSESHDVFVNEKSLSIFVQTDKATYKPGDMVLFRAIVATPSLHPFNGSMNVVIYDSSSNKIVQWNNVKNVTGVFTQSLQLSTQTPLGDWQIEVIAQANSIKKSFTVAEYVLPKFEVKVILPTYFVVNYNKPTFQKDFLILVSAIYTYGQPVIGRATVSVSISWYDPIETIDVQLVNGIAQISMNTSRLLNLVPKNNSPSLEMLSWQTIVVYASVLETATDIVLNGTGTVSCTGERNSLQFLSITPSNYKPGLPFVAYLQLAQNDKSPPLPEDVVDPVTGVNKVVTVTVSQTLSSSNPSPLNINVPVTTTGYMTFSFSIDPNTTYVSLTASYFENYTNNTVMDWKSLSKFNSRDQESIQLSIATSNSVIQPDTNFTFNVKTTKNVLQYTYEILGKGELVLFKTITESIGKTTHSFTVLVDSLTAQLLAPSANIVVWCVTSTGGEIIADSLQLTVNATFTNKVSVKFDKALVAPSDSVNLTISACSKSFIGVLAVDKSVLLLKSGNDLSSDIVSQDIAGYSTARNGGSGGIFFPWRFWWWPGYLGGADTTSVLNNAGLFCATDGWVENTPPPIYFWRGEAGPGGAMPAPAPPGPSGAAGQEPTTIRSNFLETWLWVDSTVRTGNVTQMAVKAPDTMTSYVTSVFALSDLCGMGLASTQLTVFQPFFISLNLPYAIIRGEEFALRVTIFNYQPYAVDVVVTLNKSDQFMVRQDNSMGPQSLAASTTLHVESNNSNNAFFWIVAQSLGQVALNVKAVSPQAADAVKVMLLVKPEGFAQSYSSIVFIQLNQTGSSFRTSVNVALPPSGQLVPGSQNIQCTVIGDLMGPSVQGLDSLLQMPYGCGEQNMLNFAPDVYILFYLDAAGLATSAIRTKAINFMLSGYQAELTYQRIDGSFSAFGSSDTNGSVWLSSFVCKAFSQAKPYISIEDIQLAPTLNWIAAQQLPNGSFSEPGRVIHTDMQGGSASGVSMTAYIVISLYQNRNNSLVSFHINDTISKAKIYLERQLTSIQNDAYVLAIVTYALTLVNSSQAASAQNKLAALAINKDGMMHWERTTESAQPPSIDNIWRCPVQQAPSVNIELTAYALLVYVKANGVLQSWPIAKWLISQRNSNGGWSATQDTVMALEALSVFAKMVSGGSAKSVNVSCDSGSTHSQFQTINAATALLYQTVELPSNSSSVNVSAKGQGTALVQLNVNYNVYVTSSKPGINLTVTTQTNGTKLSLTCCCSWKGADQSGMVLLQVSVLTGYTPTNIDDINDQTGGQVPRADYDGSTIVFYINELTAKQLCIILTFENTGMVNNIQSSPVSLYRYYDKQYKQTLLYQPTAERNTTWCQTCPGCSNCDPKISFQCQDCSCLKKNVVCNGVKDCADGSDELDCTLPTLSCAGILNCQKCSSATKCTTCKPNYAPKVNSAANTTCVACGTIPFCAKCTNLTFCTECIDAPSVGPNVNHSGSCGVCGSNCVSCKKNGATNCDSCVKLMPSRYNYVLVNQRCVRCANNCLQCDQNGPGKCDDKKCQTNYTFNPTTKLCQPVVG